MNAFFGPSEVLGIEVGEEEIRAVALSVGFRKMQVTETRRIPFPSDARMPFADRVGAALRELKEMRTSSPDWTVTGMPGNRVMVRRLSVPHAKAESVAELVKYEMEPLLPFPAEDLLVDCLVRSDDPKEGMDVTACAVRKEDVERHLALLEAASLDPRMVGALNLGAYLAFEISAAKPLPPGLRILVDLGREETHLVVFDPKGPLLVRTLASEEEENVSEDAADAAGKRLAGEIEISLIQFPERPEEVIVTGERSALPGILESLEAALGIPCRPWNALEAFPNRLSEKERRQGAAFASLLGVVASVLSRPGRRIDFRREAFAFKRTVAQMRGKLIYLGVLALLIAGLSAGNLWLRIEHRRHEAALLGREIRTLYLDTFPGSRIVVDELQQMKNAIRQRKEELLAMGFHPNRVLMIDMLRAISNRIPEQVGIRITDLSIDAEAIQISGQAGSFEAVDALKDRLMQLPTADQVKVEGANVSRFGKVIEFRLKVVRKAES